MECSNPGCRFRYPAAVADQRGAVCPSCGAPARIAATPPDAVADAADARGTSGREAPRLQQGGRVIDLLVDNVRSIYNAGSMFRTADGAGVEHLYLCGITPTPDHPRLAKTALGAEEEVPWSYHPNAVDLACGLRAGGRALWALENGPGARSIYQSIGRSMLDERPIVLIVGNELVGVDPVVLEICDAVVMLPMEGTKKSLNVATACGIALYTLRHGR